MRKYKNILIGLSLISLIIILSQYSSYLYKKQMQNTVETKAFYIENIHMKNIGPTSFYYYSVEKKRYEGYFRDSDKFLKKGDTILIKYPKDNPSLSEVVNQYYMQKYQYLKGK